jgi:hypothetical protein
LATSSVGTCEETYRSGNRCALTGSLLYFGMVMLTDHHLASRMDVIHRERLPVLRAFVRSIAERRTATAEILVDAGRRAIRSKVDNKVASGSLSRWQIPASLSAYPFAAGELFERCWWRQRGRSVAPRLRREHPIYEVALFPVDRRQLGGRRERALARLRVRLVGRAATAVEAGVIHLARALGEWYRVVLQDPRGGDHRSTR